jgi:hypothetical protein
MRTGAFCMLKVDANIKVMRQNLVFLAGCVQRRTLCTVLSRVQHPLLLVSAGQHAGP